MKIRIGFTGTRNSLTDAQREALEFVLLTEFNRNDEQPELHHGDCVGADAACHAIARAMGYRIVLHPPADGRFRANLEGEADSIFPARPYLERNRQIVDNTDLLVACPQGPEEKRSGTWSTVRHARRWGVPVIVVWPDGRAEREVRE